MNKKQKLLYGLVLVIALFLGFYIKEKREEKNRVDIEQSIKKTEELQLPAAETKTAKEWLELGDKYINKAKEHFQQGDKNSSVEEALTAGEAYYKGLQVVKDPYEKSILVNNISYVSTKEGTIELLEGEVKANTKYSYIYNTLLRLYSKYGGTFEQIKGAYDKGITSLENNDKLSKEEEDEVRFMLNGSMGDIALSYNEFAIAYEANKKVIELLTERNKKLIVKGGTWSLYQNLALSCIGLKKYDEALDNVNYIYKDLGVKDNGDIMNIFGIIYFNKKNYEEARKYYKKAMSLGSKDAENNLKYLEKVEKENSKIK